MLGSFAPKSCRTCPGRPWLSLAKGGKACEPSLFLGPKCGSWADPAGLGATHCREKPHTLARWGVGEACPKAHLCKQLWQAPPLEVRRSVSKCNVRSWLHRTSTPRAQRCHAFPGGTVANCQDAMREGKALPCQVWRISPSLSSLPTRPVLLRGSLTSSANMQRRSSPSGLKSCQTVWTIRARVTKKAWC